MLLPLWPRPVEGLRSFLGLLHSSLACQVSELPDPNPPMAWYLAEVIASVAGFWCMLRALQVADARATSTPAPDLSLRNLRFCLAFGSFRIP